MTKLILSSIIAVFSSYIGIAIKKVYIVRVKFMESYSTFLSELIENISFEKMSLTPFIERVKDRKSREFRILLDAYIEAIKENKELNITSKYIKKADREIIQNCFNQIGRTDELTQISSLKGDLIVANSLVQMARQDRNTKGELYGKLGILLGLALLILLI